MRYAIIVVVALMLTACKPDVQNSLDCRTDSDCVMESYYEGHCCQDTCSQHPLSKATQKARESWRMANCDPNQLNGSLDTPELYEKWSFCLMPAAPCEQAPMQAKCENSKCVARPASP